MSTQISQGTHVIEPPRSHAASSLPIPRRGTNKGQPQTPTNEGRKKAPQPHGSVTETGSIRSTNPDDVILLRLPEVKAMTGLSKSSLYALIREGTFPHQFALGHVPSPGSSPR